jgi:hypothetical protein
LGQTRHHGLRRFVLVVLVQRQQLGIATVYAVGAQELLGMARVLAGNRIAQTENMQSAQGNVGQVANRGGDDY